MGRPTRLIKTNELSNDTRTCLSISQARLSTTVSQYNTAVMCSLFEKCSKKPNKPYGSIKYEWYSKLSMIGQHRYPEGHLTVSILVFHMTGSPQCSAVPMLVPTRCA